MDIVAVIGSPVAHSLSPAIHNAAFRAAGLDWVYVAFEVAPGDGRAAVEAMRTLGLGGRCASSAVLPPGSPNLPLPGGIPRRFRA